MPPSRRASILRLALFAVTVLAWVFASYEFVRAVTYVRLPNSTLVLLVFSMGLATALTTASVVVAVIPRAIDIWEAGYRAGQADGQGRLKAIRNPGE